LALAKQFLFQSVALFRTLPTPTNDLFPRLLVEVCLLLAPDVNFFLNSRKQGLPCQRSLFFSFLQSVGSFQMTPRNESFDSLTFAKRRNQNCQFFLGDIVTLRVMKNLSD